jgi:hypothetical protein
MIPTPALDIADGTIAPTGAEDRAYLVGVLARVSGPVLEALSENKLKQKFPVRDWDKHRQDCTCIEAFARTLAGVAPWVELGPDATPEGQMRERFGLMARRSLINATDPNSPDYLRFGNSSTVGRQALAEAAYLAHALLRAPKVLWEPLTEGQKQNVIASLKTSRTGAIDEPLGGYRAHGYNVSAKVKEGKVNKPALRKFLQREILTDQSLADYGKKIGVDYRLGTLTGALPHVQQLFLHEKLFRQDRCFGEKSLLKLFILYIKLLFTLRSLPLYKKPIIAAWSLAVMLLPKSLAEPLVVMGYRYGVVLAATRVLSRSHVKPGANGLSGGAGLRVAS